MDRLIGGSAEVSKNVCFLKGHEIARFNESLDQHGNILRACMDLCTQCGMSLEEIRGDYNASEQSNSKTS